jgi:hypothetical protein
MNDGPDVIRHSESSFSIISATREGDGYEVIFGWPSGSDTDKLNEFTMYSKSKLVFNGSSAGSVMKMHNWIDNTTDKLEDREDAAEIERSSGTFDKYKLIYGLFFTSSDQDNVNEDGTIKTYNELPVDLQGDSAEGAVLWRIVNEISELNGNGEPSYIEESYDFIKQ